MKKGYILLISAEFCFAAATVFAKFATTNTDIPALEATFMRFFLGFIITWMGMSHQQMSFKPNNVKLVGARVFFNTIAVILFFLSVKYTTITNANMLNMTYPVFMLFLAPWLLKEKVAGRQYLFLLIALVGIAMVVHPDFHQINIGDLYGLLSGATGAVAIASLRIARKYDSTHIIIFYLMGCGTLINAVLLIPGFVMPTWWQFLWLSVSGLLGYVGQVLLTAGYRYVDATKGSMLSSSRIIFAFLLGVFIFSEPFAWPIIAGIVLIVFAIIGVTKPSAILFKQIGKSKI